MAKSTQNCHFLRYDAIRYLCHLSLVFFHLQSVMMKLTQKQAGVGEVLREGNGLIKTLPSDEAKEVRQQMTLLNDRWENLRISAMDRQNM